MTYRTVVLLRARNAALHRLTDVALAIAGIAADLGMDIEAKLAEEGRR